MRTKPYTKKGIKRVPCFRCGRPSSHQWQICSLGNKWAGVCTECDIGLNGQVLKYLRFEDADMIIKRYKQEKEKEDE